MSKIQMHAVMHGKVQGVFFRDTTKQIAIELGICGTVQNLPDGTVEIYAQGERPELELLVSRLTADSGPGVVSNCEITFGEPSRSFEGFQVIF
jgi:acylphosphatase